MSNELLKTIDVLIEQKTFSLDALEGIKQIRDKATKLESDLNEMKSKYNVVLIEKETLSSELEKSRSINREWSKRDEELSAREKEADICIYNADKHKAVADTYKTVMETIFRPNIVRETIQSTVPITMQSGSNGAYSSYVQAHQETKTITREEG